MYTLLKGLEHFKNTLNSYAFGEFAHASFTPGTTEQEVKIFLNEQGAVQVLVQKAKPTVEDCFIKLLKS
jgi:hypothetical protein